MGTGAAHSANVERSILDDLLRSAQPKYEQPVRQVLQGFLNVFGDAAFQGVDRDGFTARFLWLVQQARADVRVRLSLLNGLSALSWWSDVTISDQERGASSALARRILFDSVTGAEHRPQTTLPAARANHAVFVGVLVGVMHSPTRGSLDYVRALAADPENARIDVFHAGTLTESMRAHAAELFGENGGRVSYISMEQTPDWLARAEAGGPYTYHFWCEDALAPHISRLAMRGPTIMFTCGDLAPAQFADVYWYGQDESYIGALWRRQGAPEHFVDNYRFLRSTPLNLPSAKLHRTRGDLGIEPRDIVLVSVGNRLGRELDQPFVDGLGAFLRAHSDVRWMVVGPLPDYWISTFQKVFARQFMHVEYDGDLPSLLAHCDVFANPFRGGGGHSSVIAIDAGAVVLARGDFGDVGACIPPAHRAQHAHDYFERLGELVADPALRSAWSVEQRAYLARSADQEAFAAELGEVCDLAHRRFAERLPLDLKALFAQ